MGGFAGGGGGGNHAERIAALAFPPTPANVQPAELPKPANVSKLQGSAGSPDVATSEAGKSRRRAKSTTSTLISLDDKLSGSTILSG